MLNYPEILPTPSRDGYGGSFALKMNRFEMDDGGYRGARQWASQPFRYNFTWQLTSYYLAQVFEAWVEYTLNGGVEYVEIPYMDGNVKCRAATGVPTFTPNGAGWTVTMQFDELRAAPGAFPGRSIWPDTLPDFDKTNFQLMPTKGFAVSDIETGNPQVRKRFRSRVTTYSGRMFMTAEQRSEFWTFYQNKLMHGISAFDAPFSGPAGTTRVRAKIIEQPTESAEGSCFWMSLKMETTNAPLMSSDDYFAAVATYENDYCEPDYVVNGYVGTYAIGF